MSLGADLHIARGSAACHLAWFCSECMAHAAQFGKQSAVGAAAVAATRDPIVTTVYQVIERRPCMLLLLLWGYCTMQFGFSALSS